MESAPNLNDTTDATISENLQQAKDLVKYLEAGDVDNAGLIINEFCTQRDNNIYQDLGKLTRDLHQTINDIAEDGKLEALMNTDMPDARHNLNHVIELTEDAANKTIAAIEVSIPVLEELSERSSYLQRLTQERNKNQDEKNEQSFIDDELEGFFENLNSDVKHVQEQLNTILMAQSYQDISGQIIQRVNKMVHEVEENLLGILKINSNQFKETKKPEVVKDSRGYGPAVPGAGAESADVLTSQDDVDDLLSTLGF